MKFLKLIVFYIFISSAFAVDTLPIPNDGPFVISERSDLEKFWHKAINQPLDTQVAIFAELVIDKHWPAYERMVSSDKNNILERSKQWLSKMNAEKMVKTIETFKLFENEVPAQIEKFKHVFQDSKLNAIVYLMISMRFDGKQSKIQGNNIVAFGIDKFISDPSALDITFSHELTHLYQQEKTGGTRGYSITKAAWQEGLATYTSGILNPGNSDERLLADSLLGTKCREDRNNIVKKFLAEKNENTDASFTRWFSGGASNTDLPVRAGYCVGLIAVRYLASSYSLQEMLTLPFDRVEDIVQAALTEIVTAY